MYLNYTAALFLFNLMGIKLNMRKCSHIKLALQPNIYIFFKIVITQKTLRELP